MAEVHKVAESGIISIYSHVGLSRMENQWDTKETRLRWEIDGIQWK